METPPLIGAQINAQSLTCKGESKALTPLESCAPVRRKTGVLAPAQGSRGTLGGAGA